MTTIEQMIAATVAELQRLREIHDHWRIAWSGGKDSSLLATITAWAIASGQVRMPRILAVDQSDTRQEIAPLVHAAETLRREFEEFGFAVNVVEPDQDKGLWVNVLGRGVVPPNSMTARWCTRQLKQEPMAKLLAGFEGPDKPLMLVGLRTGESATRDRSMAVACSRDGGECGQGRFYFDTPDQLAARAAPIVHWKTCKVWAWLKHYAPDYRYGEWSTELIADAYGGQGETEEDAGRKSVRTGCVACPLVEEDSALLALISRPEWAYLAPLTELSVIWRELRLPANRIKKPGYEVRDGRPVMTVAGWISKRNSERRIAQWKIDCIDAIREGRPEPKRPPRWRPPQRTGPIQLAVRLNYLDRVLAIQARVNDAAIGLGRPMQWIIPPDDEHRIRDLIAANTWPERWDGDEPLGDEPMHTVRADGSIQLNLLAGQRWPVQ